MFLAMMRILEPDGQSGFFHTTPCLGEEGQVKVRWSNASQV